VQDLVTNPYGDAAAEPQILDPDPLYLFALAETELRLACRDALALATLALTPACGPSA
jgi:hypothetical protein